MTHIPTFPEFDPENYKTNVQNRWVKYTARLENFFLAKKITDDARKRALVLHYVGEHTHDIYEANKSDEEPDDIKYKKSKNTHYKEKRTCCGTRIFCMQTKRNPNV